MGPCGACGRGPFCPVCATPINHTCIPRRPVPQDPPGANGAPAEPPQDAVADPAVPALQDAVSPGGAAVSHDRLAGKSLAVPSDAVVGVLIPLGPRHDGRRWETPPQVVEAVRLVPSPSLFEMFSDILGRNGPEAQPLSTGPRGAALPSQPAARRIRFLQVPGWPAERMPSPTLAHTGSRRLQAPETTRKPFGAQARRLSRANPDLGAGMGFDYSSKDNASSDRTSSSEPAQARRERNLHAKSSRRKRPMAAASSHPTFAGLIFLERVPVMVKTEKSYEELCLGALQVPTPVGSAGTGALSLSPASAHAAVQVRAHGGGGRGFAPAAMCCRLPRPSPKSRTR